ncbi:fructose-6-phosphate aldolase [Rhodocaloribacter litoris]|uniref:fructose-6-phosphate aldolase n=1 Tax=Rhodocaloribacter litoris TaxID=2558931 RepID=UPI00142082A2|nr:fructose-6-phosphate aldolase [Rhodocaloribacter litoris]QXD15474.1 fructose-6-phosphate aldolase [Rhodocaloribacter litoris]GIV60974.1 MAG: putative transaldolase [Rhodothermaceae bacterium]
MKFFIDTADLDEIREANAMGVLDGVTTNPSLMMKAGGADFHAHIRAICEIVDGDVSAEVTATDFDGILREARTLAKIHDNVVVKVPLILDGIKAIRALAAEGIRTNCTLCFSPTQALVAAKAGATYISPFIGRLDDISTPGMELIEQIVQIYANYGFETEVLAASIRHPMHVVEAALAGADVATMPFGVIKQLIKHPLTDIGLERFLADWRKYEENAAVAGNGIRS